MSVHPYRAAIVPHTLVIPLDTEVAIHSRADSDKGAWILLAFKGYEATTEKPCRAYVAIDAERACGVMAQLRFILTEAGVNPDVVALRVNELTDVLNKQKEAFRNEGT